jgi:hypothetical protein
MPDENRRLLFLPARVDARRNRTCMEAGPIGIAVSFKAKINWSGLVARPGQRARPGLVVRLVQAPQLERRVRPGQPARRCDSSTVRERS